MDDFLDNPTGGGNRLNPLAKREEQSLQARPYESPDTQIAKLLHTSGLFPGAGSIAGVFTIIQFGKEVGLSPVVALNNINIIKGKIAMSGQSMLALATKHGVNAEFTVETDKECTVIFEREGHSSYVSIFTIEDAEKAGLLGLDDNKEVQKEAWRKYTKTMLKWRAVAQGLRVIAADILAGIYTQEEIDSIEVVAQNDTPTEAVIVGEVAQNDTPVDQDKNNEQTSVQKETQSTGPTKATAPQIKKFNVMSTQSGLSHFSHPLKKWLVNVDGSGLSGDKPSGKDLNKDFCSKLISNFEKFSTLFFASPSNRQAIEYIFTTLKDDNKRKVIKTISSYVEDLDSTLKNISIDKADEETLVNYLGLFLVALENQECNRISDKVKKEGMSVDQVLATLRELGFKPEVRERIDISKKEEKPKEETKDAELFDF